MPDATCADAAAVRFPVIRQLRARGRTSPIDRIDTIEVSRTPPRPAAAADLAAVLDAICSRRPRKDVPLGVLRDRVLFETAYVCGARASEVTELINSGVSIEVVRRRLGHASTQIYTLLADTVADAEIRAARRRRDQAAR